MSGHRLADQAERLIGLGVPELAGLTADRFRRLIDGMAGDRPEALLVVHPDLVPPSRLAPLIERDGNRGFVVVDMDDVDEFGPIDGLEPPTDPVYTIGDVDRGDDMLNWSPAEALPELTARGRRPLTMNEGICWLLQQPESLEPGRCFMTIGSRKRNDRGGLDARAPAIWISSGSGRDGAERQGTPKVGWCWHNNRHTWLGFASCAA